MGSPAQAAPLVLSQGGVKNCQEDTALGEPCECPPPNHKWESSGSALCIHQDNALQPTSPRGEASSRWEPHPPSETPREARTSNGCGPVPWILAGLDGDGRRSPIHCNQDELGEPCW